MDRNQTTVRNRVVKWFSNHGRSFPWRETTDPYQVLIAETLLRRTTASAVSRVYGTFLNRFESPKRLARAKESTIARHLISLGLQSKRAHELKKMASIIIKKHSGNVPRTHEDLLALPGVGAYIASAVRNFAYGDPAALVDGNVVHFISRVFDIQFKGPVDSEVWEFMNQFGGKHQEAKLYWGIIDLVATVCLRINPRCHICPLSEVCKSSKNGDRIHEVV
ncbi:MAG: A/G-specific adenine glycosylase [Candidatus Thorarchaeota archaeon]|jgi:A/G-specific adenine glycosylase